MPVSRLDGRLRYGSFVRHRFDFGTIYREATRELDFRRKSLYTRSVDPKNVQRGHSMTRVRVSSKYQMVIPREVRKKHRIEKGQMIDVFSVGSHIAVVPDVDIVKLKGAFPEITLEGFREEEDRY